MHLGAVKAGDQALVVDDLIATGGTLCAAMKLLGSVLYYVNFPLHWVLVAELYYFFAFYIYKGEGHYSSPSPGKY